MDDSRTNEPDQAVMIDSTLPTPNTCMDSSTLPPPPASTVAPAESSKLLLSPRSSSIAGQQLSEPSPSTTSKPGISVSNGDIPTRIFRFLSTATTQSLSAVGVGLAATTYLVLGRVGLMLIGAFGGIALFAAWEARNPDLALALRGETSSELLARVIEYRKRDKVENSIHGVESKIGNESADLQLDDFGEEPALASSFENFRPETRQALNGLVDAIIRDYVQWWYQPIVPSDQSFPLSCRRVLTSFLVSVSNHLSRKRPADAFLDFLTNSSSIVIVLFSELATAFADHAEQVPQQQQSQSQAQNPDANPTISAADAIYSYLASNPNSSLANLLSQHQQAIKFRMVADDLLGFLDRECYDCNPARNFLREIAATSILESTLQTCSKPEWINTWIVYLLEAGEPDFSQAIDVGMQTRPDTATAGNSSSNGGATTSGATASAHMHHASIDIDGNVGNIALPKNRRSSSETERADRSRRKESVAHKKQLSRADEEMEEAMEEMKRLNQMIADEEARRTSKEMKSAVEFENSLAGATQHQADDPKSQPVCENDTISGLKNLHENGLFPSNTTADQISHKASFSLSGDEHIAPTAGTISTPITPRSSTQESPKRQSLKSEALRCTEASGANVIPAAEPLVQFTSFDQLVPPAHEEGELTDNEGTNKVAALLPLTLHHATITIHDEPVTDKGRIRGRPTWDFLIQIEPANSHYPGWMIVRKYADFERLHEVIRRIANISGATAFTEQHGTLPNWKLHTRGSLRGELERYVRDACWYQSLAESEGMKRFLEKDTNNMPASAKTGLQAFEAIGKNMLDVLSNAPKGVAESSKVVVGGVTGVFGNLGNLGTNIGLGGSSHKKHASSISLANPVPSLSAAGAATTTSTTSPPASALQDVTAYTNRLSVSTPPRMDSGYFGASSRRSRDSMDSQRSSVVASQSSRNLPLPERRMSYQFQNGLTSLASGEGEDGDGRGRLDNTWDYAPAGSSNRGSQHNSRASSSAGFPRSPSSISLSGTRLTASSIPGDSLDGVVCGTGPLPSMSPLQPETSGHTGVGAVMKGPPRSLHRVATSGTTLAKQFSPLTESETRVAVELLFAVINELYTLSSAWNIRRTLLTAAKSFLLRPGNPSLVSIQSLLQKSVLDDNTTDAGMAGYLRKLRENSLPTDSERAAWPAEMTAEEKERLRVKARRLLIRSGVPVALMGVMGQSATSDALGRVFDCLQIEEVARGLMFGLMLQAARIVTH
ncbi:hypothetical protein SEPCBS57363_001927 [Sporothrix epigloea]|uniref:PXA domain-containing protein n=1 Tax=Sporothrix epigloea TaxID=1892477 RepID=A0ABP0DD02_9PEZI